MSEDSLVSLFPMAVYVHCIKDVGVGKKRREREREGAKSPADLSLLTFFTMSGVEIQPFRESHNGWAHETHVRWQPLGQERFCQKWGG
jgi:hypothetical protein